MSGYLYDVVETAIIEQRAYPRFAADAKALLNGIDARLRNISRSGAQVACASADAGALPEPLDGQTVRLTLMLGGEVAEVTAEAVYGWIDGELLVVGMSYLDDAEPGRAGIHAFVDDIEVRQAPL